MPALKKNVAEPNQAIERDQVRELLNAILHEARGPASQIQTFIELLQKRGADLDTEFHSLLGYIGSATARLDSSLAAIRRYSDALEGPCQYVYFPVSAPLTFAIDRLGPELKAVKARITHDELPELKADPNRIGIVFYELLSNAVKFCEYKPPAIHVSSSATPEGIMISIADNGIGIDSGQFERIFKPFTKLGGVSFPAQEWGSQSPGSSWKCTADGSGLSPLLRSDQRFDLASPNRVYKCKRAAGPPL